MVISIVKVLDVGREVFTHMRVELNLSHCPAFLSQSGPSFCLLPDMWSFIFIGGFSFIVSIRLGNDLLKIHKKPLHGRGFPWQQSQQGLGVFCEYWALGSTGQFCIVMGFGEYSSGMHCQWAWKTKPQIKHFLNLWLNLCTSSACMGKMRESGAGRGLH